jgi:outer membrane lipoprotein-sorting protein
MQLKRFIAALFLSAVCGSSLVTPSLATGSEASAEGKWDLKQLMLDLGQVRVAKAQFVERRYLSMLKEPLQFSGTLVYIAPDRLEKNTLRPKAESMVVDRDRLTIEGDSGRQRRILVLPDHPEIWAFVESIRATLAGDLPTLNRFYKVSLEGRSEEWQLLLEPSEEKMRTMVKSIRISGKESSIRIVEILEADGDRSVMTVSSDAS